VKLTVLMPVHRVDRFLFESVDSVTRDLPADSELLLVLNGNALNREYEIRSQLENPSPVRFIPSEDLAGGIVSALNMGLTSSRGEFIARMDSDDLVIPGRFAKQIAYLDSHLDVAVVGGQYQAICVHGSMLWKSHLPKRVAGFRVAFLTSAVAHPTVMYRRRVIFDEGGYKTTFPHVEDQDLWMRILKRNQIHNVGQVVLQYRIHADQTSVIYAKIQSANFLRSFLHNRKLGLSNEETAFCGTPDEFISVIRQSKQLSKFRKQFYVAIVRYWSFISEVETSKESRLTIAFAHPLSAVLFGFINFKSLVWQAFSNRQVCAECSQEEV